MIVFVLRHADRTSEDDLSPAGHIRAQLLARMLGKTGVSIAYRSDAVRAKLTLDPLKTALGAGLQVVEIPIIGPNGPDNHVREIVHAIKSHPENKVAVVVSHSNTVGPIVEGLGGRPGGPIAEDEFDRLFILATTPAAAIDGVEIRFGDPTP